MTYSYARQNLAKLMDEVEQDRAPVYISRQSKRGAAVLMSCWKIMRRWRQRSIC